MKYERIKEEVIKEEREGFKKDLERVEEDLNKALKCYRKTYKGDEETQKNKFVAYLKKQRDKTIREKIDKIVEVENIEGEMPNPLIITVEWKDSRMWGSNPRASTNYGFIGRSVGGCGYDKHSTATAEALNNTKWIVKALYDKEEQRLKEQPETERRDFIGYGSGYYCLPYFEGGVGVSSHRNILKELGYNMEHITSTKTVDAHRIEKV